MIPFVRAGALVPAVSWLARAGAPVERWLGAASISPHLLADPEALVPLSFAYRFLELVARGEHPETLVRIAEAGSSFDLGGYGEALARSRTVGDYLRTGARLISEVHSSGVRFWLTSEGDRIRFHQHRNGPPGLGNALADVYTLVLTLEMLRRFSGGTWCPDEIRLPADRAQLAGAPRSFGDARVLRVPDHTSFTIPKTLLHLRIAPIDSRALQVGERCRAEAEPLPRDFVASVEQLVLTLAEDGFPSLEAVAEAACLSPRTLQRRLLEAGTSHRRLLAGVRIRQARRWLGETDVPVSEIASMLGYRDASNFSRAFLRETGAAPGAYRRARGHG